MLVSQALVYRGGRAQQQHLFSANQDKAMLLPVLSLAVAAGIANAAGDGE